MITVVLRKNLQIVSAFVAVGFVLPWLFLAYYMIAHRMDKYPGTTLLFYLCPSSIMSMGLDNASFLTGFIGWLLISASNAVLYAVPGIAIALLRYFWKSN
jgi:hypothetical protein